MMKKDLTERRVQGLDEIPYLGPERSERGEIRVSIVGTLTVIKDSSNTIHWSSQTWERALIEEVVFEAPGTVKIRVNRPLDRRSMCLVDGAPGQTFLHALGWPPDDEGWFTIRHFSPDGFEPRSAWSFTAMIYEPMKVV